MEQGKASQRKLLLLLSLDCCLLLHDLSFPNSGNIGKRESLSGLVQAPYMKRENPNLQSPAFLPFFHHFKSGLSVSWKSIP